MIIRNRRIPDMVTLSIILALFLGIWFVVIVFAITGRLNLNLSSRSILEILGITFGIMLFGPIVVMMCISHLRFLLFTFVIDEEGITRKAIVGKDTFIAWNDFKHFGVEEICPTHFKDYYFALSFSTIPVKAKQYKAGEYRTLTKKSFFVVL